MKTLDEVIKAFEHCTDANPDPDFDSCAECPYCDKVKGCCRDNAHMTDALHYLKEYQAILPLVPSLINTAIAVQKKGKTIG